MTKFTFATALIAASASALDLMAVPDYSAGLIYGLTGANHLEEIEACYHGSHDLAQDAHTALIDLQNGRWLKSITEFKQVMDKFPDTLSGCKNLDEDLATIKNWATIFTQPEALIKEASKHYALHRKTIKGDIADEQAHWAAHQYFNAGIDTAMALTELIPMKG